MGVIQKNSAYLTVGRLPQENIRMETIPHRRALQHILMQLLSENPDGLTPKQVYKFVGDEYKFPEEWYLNRPTSSGFDDLKASGIDDWHLVPQNELVALIDTEPQFHHILRWSREQLKVEGYLDLTAPRGVWRLTEKGIKAVPQLKVDSYSPEEVAIIKSRKTVKHRIVKETPIAFDYGNLAPEKVETTTYRILRDTTLARDLKTLHKNKCQICGETITLSTGDYSEAHHIKPLGTPHQGPDVSGNILVLCPNHHVMCDYGAIKLDTTTLRLHPDHILGDEFLRYHNEDIFRM